MIRLPDLNLLATAQTDLDDWQREIDANPSYSDRVAYAKRQFSIRNRTSNPTFKEVRQKLSEMCQGARRCGYCEDSVADEVEHIKPKDWYPEETFRWNNYLYACGQCNGPKSRKFAVFDASTRIFVHLIRDPNGPVVPPPVGDVVLLNPRLEEPLEFLELDLVNTFFYVPRYMITGEKLRRADYTIEVLRLNKRDYLVEARKNAFDSFHARFVTYNNQKCAGKGPSVLSRLVDSLQRMPHQSVWREMVRQRNAFVELSALFSANPEALNW